MDSVVVTKAEEVLLGGKRYKSPFNTEFISGHLRNKGYLLSWDPFNMHYIFTEDNKIVCGGVQKEEILEALENIKNGQIHPSSVLSRKMSQVIGVPLAYF